jgi:hypothetical protein
MDARTMKAMSNKRGAHRKPQVKRIFFDVETEEFTDYFRRAREAVQ